MYKFEIYQDRAGEYRFRFKASNGETMFSSEGYKAKASAIHAIEIDQEKFPRRGYCRSEHNDRLKPPFRKTSKHFSCQN